MGLKKTDNGKMRQNFINAMTKIHGAELRVGWFETAKYPDGTPVTMVAALHEFGGTISVPERQHEMYFHRKADGSVGNRFVRREKSNFAQTATRGAHTITIPARPFMRPTVAKNQKHWKTEVEHSAKAVLNGQAPAETLLNRFGLVVAGDIKKTISQVFTPPLKPSTIKRKMKKLKGKTTAGSLTKPLVETGFMIGSVTHELKKK